MDPAGRPLNPPPGGEEPVRPEVVREEAEAVLGARLELGKEYDQALAESFADRIEQVVEARVAASGRGPGALERREALDSQAGQRQLKLGVVSLGCGIPITAIADSLGDGLPGVIVAWLGIVGVNAAHALQSRWRG